jgi:hypothetical protein
MYFFRFVFKNGGSNEPNSLNNLTPPTAPLQTIHIL